MYIHVCDMSTDRYVSGVVLKLTSFETLTDKSAEETNRYAHIHADIAFGYNNNA